MGRGVLATAVALLVSTIGAAFPLLVARLLGQAALGTYALAWGSADLLSKLGVLGLDQTTVALAAQRRAAGDTAGARRLLRDALLLGVGLSALVGVLAALAFAGLGPRLGQSPAFVRAELLMLLALPGVALYRVSNAASRGLGFMRHDVYSGGLAENVTTLVVLLALVALGVAELAPVLAAACGFTAGGLVAFGLARRALQRLERAAIPAPLAATAPAEAAPAVGVRGLARRSAVVAAYGLLNLLMNRLDVLVVGWLVGRAPGLTAAGLGVYAAASELAGVARKVRQALEPAFIAAVAGHAGEGRRELAHDAFARATRWLTAALLPLAGALALAPGLALAVFGRGFAEGAPWLVTLACAHALAAWAGLGETVLLVRRPGLNLANSALAVFVQGGLAILWVPRLGPWGAALATLAAFATLAAVRAIQLARLGQPWPFSAMGRPLLAFACGAGPALLARLAIGGLRGQAVAVVLLLAGYAAGWARIGLDAEDRAVLRRIAGREA